MNIMHLRYALAIEETGSVTRAAEKLFVAQPNISRSIRELEASVGLTLFQRTALGMVATEEGKPFLDHARHIVQEIDNLKSTYENSGSKQYFSVSGHGGRYIAEAFASFVAKEDSGMYLYTYKEESSETVVARVLQGLCGMGIIRFRSSSEAGIRQYMTAHELQMEKLFEAPLLYTVSAHSPLAKLKEVSPKDAEKLTEIQDGAIYTRDEEKSKGRQIRIFDKESRGLTLRAATDTYFLSIKEDASYLRENALVQRPAAEGGVSVQDALITRKKHIYTKQEKLFLDFLYKNVCIYKKI